MTSNTSSVAVDIASNKELTLNPAVRGRTAGPPFAVRAHPDDAIRLADRIGYPVVVKPLDGNHGRGVILDLTDHDGGPRPASRSPRRESRNGWVIVETYITGIDYRCLVIDGQIAAIAERVPAHVIGDGKPTPRRTGRADQRRPAPRRRTREGADPDQDRPGRRRPGAAQGFAMDDVPPAGHP